MTAMTSDKLASLQAWPLSETRRAVRRAVTTICLYVASYVALDWISFFAVLPGIGFTPWNPPPVASLALLLSKGLRYAPALFLAGVISEGVVAGFPQGFGPTLAAQAVNAIGYTAVAAALRRWVHVEQGFPRTADVARLLLICGMGTCGIAVLVVSTLAAMRVVPPNLFFVSIRQFFIGDLTGIVGLFPVLFTIRLAWERWKDLRPAIRAFDIGLFGLGLALALLLVFGLARSKELQFFYLLLPPVVWVGVRHGLPWCTVAILVEQIALLATVTSLHYPTGDFLAYQILSLVIAATGLILGAVVTERQRAELHLRQHQAELYRTARLTTAGALGAAVAHEISQPLATVATYAHACSRMLAAQPTDFALLGRTIAKVESETRRAGEIVERLRDFLGNTEPRSSSIDLGEVASEVVDVLADAARSNGVSLRIEAAPLPPIAADRIQIEQVLVNLIRNAIEAAADSGDYEKLVSVGLRQVDTWAELEVVDNGRGVSAQIAERLFEPFETNKRRGMGLGLSLSREIVKAHGGRLWWDQAFAPGARFALRLPIATIARP